MEDKLKQDIKEYLEENLKVDIKLDKEYPEYCNTAYAKATVRLFLENKEISISNSESISIPI